MIAGVVSAVILTRRARGGLRRLGTVVQHLLVLIGGLAGFIATLDLFGPTHETSLDLPDGRGTAHLYRESSFCSYTVWIAAPWSLSSQQQPGEFKCVESPSLTWDAAQRQVIVGGPDGAPAPPPEPFRLVLGGPC